ncbi:MAG: FAD-binding protein, partial [Raoultibacter sp.]
METKTRRGFLKTVGVGVASAAIVGIGSTLGCSSGEKTPQSTTGSSNSFDYDADVVVVGAGPSGIAAAVEAVNNGCEKVILLEALSTIGGSAIYSEGIMAGVDTQIAKRNGVTASLDDCYNQVMEWSNYQLDGDLVKITTQQCGKTIDWLIDELEIPFVDHAIAASNYGPLPIVHNVVDQGSGFAAPFEKAIASREAITLLLNTRAMRILTDENSTVCGIEATEGNKDIRISAKAVILSAGGAGGNPELLGRLIPLYQSVCPAGGPGASGDATLLAGALGAAMGNPNLFRPMVHDYEAAWAGAKAYGARLDT